MGDLRYRVDHMAYKDHVCFAAVCLSYVWLALYGLSGIIALSRSVWLMYFIGHLSRSVGLCSLNSIACASSFSVRLLEPF